MISSSRLAELQRAPPAWKFCAVQSQERFDRENAQRADQANMNGRRFFDCRKWKTTARHEKHCPAARIKAQLHLRPQETCRKYRELKRKLTERRKARAREEPSPEPPASETDARPPGHQPRGGAPARPRLGRDQEGPTEKVRKLSA